VNVTDFIAKWAKVELKDIQLAYRVVAAAVIASIMVCNSNAADLKLAENGRTDYQIVVPEPSKSPVLAEKVMQVARLVQAAFKANGADLPIVEEGVRDAGKPALYLGDTAFARANRVDASRLEGWSYVHKVVGRDVIVAGREQPAAGGTLRNPAAPTQDRVGTAKAAADFLRLYVGTRFLYPDVPGWSDILASKDWLTSPAFEFLPTPVIVVPGNLNVRQTMTLKYNMGWASGAGFYDLANNRFPIVDEAFGGHTYGRAIPPETYGKSHPEYFALLGGVRQIRDEGMAQYCISNPEVQELFYQDLLRWLDAGYETADLGQPDGFEKCECAPCSKLFDTDDWSEKLWILHRNIAERVLKARPGKQVTLMAYMHTEQPPKTFKKFPKNTCLMLCGTNEEDIDLWRDYDVPGGYIGYLYNWCPNLGTRYTPMRTPRYVEKQVKRLTANHFQAINRDGPGALFGLEGPVYYTMGRMFDDAANMQAKDLVHEFCGAAFGKAAGSMLRFYDQLYDGIELYSEYLGTRCPAWAYTDIYGGGRKHLTDPFQFLGFLYPPRLLASLEKELAQAEKSADTDKVRTRLALVRREFEYVKQLARVVHLFHAYELDATLAARDRLLDAIDARNAEIARYYDPRTRAAPGMGWVSSLFPITGHSLEHLRLAYDGYQEPFANTCVNWDTQAMRKAPLPGARKMAAKPVAEAIGLDSPQWSRAVPAELKRTIAAGAETGAPTLVRALYDQENLYLRLEGELAGKEADFPAVGRDGSLDKQESATFLLAPLGNRERYYRFRVGPRAESKSDAAAGFITDVMDPRYSQADLAWNGEWGYETRLDPERSRWVAFLRVPYKTLGVPPPEAGSVWSANFGRSHLREQGDVAHSAWSRPSGTGDGMDRDSLGELVFESGIVYANVCVARKGQTPLFPYATWATAASNIQDAVNAASDSPLVLLESGTYDLDAEIVITNAITLRGVQGAAQTVLNGRAPQTGGRCLFLNHPGAVAEGLTIQNGRVVGNGGGVYIKAGTLRRCRVTGNAVTNGSGGGVYAVSGDSLIEECDIVGNTLLSSTGSGAGVFLKGAARLLDSRITHNTIAVTPHSSFGAGVCMEGVGEDAVPAVIGCDIASNTLAQTHGGYGGGGVRMTGAGIIRNCLVRGNTGPNGSAISISGSAAATVVENTTVVGNALFFPYSGGLKSPLGRIVNVVGDQDPGFGLTALNGVFINCCFPSTNALIGSDNLAAPPGFVDAAAGNYRLTKDSPCVNTGTNLPWMAESSAYGGGPRIVGGTVDRGCYEQ
jgi:hypothetical protein